MNKAGIFCHTMETPAFKQSLKPGYGRGDWIRTSDPLHPMQVRYQTALLPGQS